MRALSYTIPRKAKQRPALVVLDTPAPQPSQSEVLVRISYAGLNNFDQETWRAKRNRSLRWSLRKGPVVSGIEMAGIVSSDGERFKKGDRVVAYTNIFNVPFFHADYVAISENQLAIIPEGVSLEGAASIIGGALTTITALDKVSDLGKNSKVLVTGASGSVGITAVQLASHLGATVEGVCHSSRSEFVIDEGASVTYAYDQNEMPDRNACFDLVFDTAPSLSFAASAGYLKPDGTYITTMPHLDISGFLKSLFSSRKWGYLMESDTDALRMEKLRSLMQVGAFHPIVDSIYTLSRAGEAFDQTLKSGKRGKVLIDFSELAD